VKCHIHGGQEVGRDLLVEHHKWPTGFGGPDVPRNIILICATCHDVLHKIAEALYHKKMGKASDLANQYLPNDPRRREKLLELSNLVASKKREYYESHPDDVPDDPEDFEEEREVMMTLAVPESLHSRLKLKASDARHGSGRKVGLYRYCIEILRAHVEEENKIQRTVKVPETWDL
jgi:tRNA A37 N6-isopentenylltransferase MiaA